MNQLGHFALVIAWVCAAYGFVAGLYSSYRRSESWYRSAAQSTIAVFGCTMLATAALLYGFLTNDYSNHYIWQFSNQAMWWVYKITALWGGMDGSMLLWCVFLTFMGMLVAVNADGGPRKLMGAVLGVANSSSLFFLTVTLFVTNPFHAIRAAFIPPDGNGLNPLLQNPLMAIHPPMLYLGFTTFSIPFAFCLGALLSGELSNRWLQISRRWVLTAWGFLTIGIILGGAWAYVELGWGGFWAWDPVENASFLPWLTGSAYLHSVMVQERKNMLKVWNVWLIAATYMLTVFGTFLTRSGIVQSVHAFASTDVGWVFLVYLSALFIAVAALTYYRRVELRPERVIESFLSRETAFLLNNVLFLAICFATLWGVMFPVLSERITGQKQTVGVPFFNAVNVPLFLALILLMGVGPLIAWRKAALTNLLKTFVTPAVTAAVLGIILLWAGVQGFYPIVSYCVCWFAFLAIVGELYRGSRAMAVNVNGDRSLLQGAGRLVKRHRDRYAGYLVHIGVLIVTIAITASMAHKIEKEITLKPGESFEVARYKLQLTKIDADDQPNYERFFATVAVSDRVTGEELEVMTPELRHYQRGNETTTEVALRPSLKDDLYLVLVGIEGEGNSGSFKIFVNPLQIWLWIGGVIMAFGTLLIILPKTSVASSQTVPALPSSAGSVRS